MLRRLALLVAVVLLPGAAIVAQSTATVNLDSVDLSTAGVLVSDVGTVAKMSPNHPDLQCAIARIKELSAAKLAQGGNAVIEHYLIEGALAGLQQLAVNGQIYMHVSGGTIPDSLNGKTLPDSVTVDLATGEVTGENYTQEARNPILLNLDSKLFEAAKKVDRKVYCRELAAVLLHEMMHTVQVDTFPPIPTMRRSTVPCAMDGGYVRSAEPDGPGCVLGLLSMVSAPQRKAAGEA